MRKFQSNKIVSPESIEKMKKNLIVCSARCAKIGKGVGASDEQCERMAKCLLSNNENIMSVGMDRVVIGTTNFPYLSACKASSFLKDTGF